MELDKYELENLKRNLPLDTEILKLQSIPKEKHDYCRQLHAYLINISKEMTDDEFLMHVQNFKKNWEGSKITQANEIIIDEKNNNNNNRLHSENNLSLFGENIMSVPRELNTSSNKVTLDYINLRNEDPFKKFNSFENDHMDAPVFKSAKKLFGKDFENFDELICRGKLDLNTNFENVQKMLEKKPSEHREKPKIIKVKKYKISTEDEIEQEISKPIQLNKNNNDFVKTCSNIINIEASNSISGVSKNPEPFKEKKTNRNIEVLQKDEVLVKVYIKYSENFCFNVNGSQYYPYKETEIYFNSFRDEFLKYLDVTLSSTQYSPSNTSKSVSLEKIVRSTDRHMESTSFDMWFGIVDVKLEKKEGFLPRAFKIASDSKPFEFSFNEFQQEELENDDNTDIRTFLDYFIIKYNKQNVTNVFISFCEEQSINNVRELMRAIESSSYLLDKYAGMKYELLEELKNYKQLKLNKKGKVNEIKEQLLFRGNLHKIKRFVFHKIGQLEKVPFLDESILNETTKCLKLEFKNEVLLNKIQEYYFPLIFSKEKMKDFNPPRGILFYGPPGTGKTTVSEKFPDLIGLTPINLPIASTEVIKGIVGQTEELLRDLCERAHLVPHLLCYLSIDEIDAIVPRRENKENQNKGDTVATLLSLIGGIKDVPNLIFIASTNFMKKIDDAFSRRMSAKFFVGRLDKESRWNLMCLKKQNLVSFEALDEATLKYLNKFMSHNEEDEKENEFLLTHNKKDQDKFGEKDLEEDTPYHTNLDNKGKSSVDPVRDVDLMKLNQILINYTPAALIKLLNDISLAFLKLEKIEIKISKNRSTDVKWEYVSLSKLREIAIEVSKQFNIKIGNFYIPEIINPADLSDESPISLNKVIPRGLVLVDLSKKKYLIKADCLDRGRAITCFEEQEMNKDKRLYNTIDVLRELITFAFSNNIMSMNLIDLTALLNNGGHEESRIYEYISETVAELKEYPTSMAIFDMDSLAGVSVSSSDGFGKSLSHSLSNVKLYEYIKSIGNNESRVEFDDKGNIKSAFWVFIVVKEPYLMDILLTAYGLDKTPEQEKRAMEEEKKQNQGKRCVRCKKNYLEKDNKNMDACNYHIGYLYDSSLNPEEWELEDYLYKSVELKIQYKSCKISSKKDSDNDSSNSKSENSFMSKKSKKKKDKNDKNPYVHICCRKHYGEQGCKNGKHSEKLEDFQNEREILKKNEYNQTLNDLIELAEADMD